MKLAKSVIDLFASSTHLGFAEIEDHGSVDKLNLICSSSYWKSCSFFLVILAR